MSGKWYCQINDAEQGPLSLEQLRELVVRGVVRPTTPVRCGQVEPWIQAHNIGLLFSHSRGSIPAASSPEYRTDSELAEKRLKMQIIFGAIIGAIVLLTLLLLLLLLVGIGSEPQMAGGSAGTGNAGGGDREGSGEGDVSGQGSSPVPGGAVASTEQSREDSAASENSSAESPGSADADSPLSSPPSPGSDETRIPPDDKPMEVYLHSQPTPISRGVSGTPGRTSKSPGPAQGSGGKKELSQAFKIDKKFSSVVYVIDMSSSMGVLNKLERVKTELIRSIDALNDNQRFSVIFFNHSFMTMPASSTQASNKIRLVSARDDAKKLAGEWISQISSGGNTKPAPAVQIAMSAKPDLIVILSDGEFGQDQVEDILRANELRGKTKQKPINCIGLSEDPQTLKEIANHSGGSYMFVQ
jgi:Mg-chelatase subunit ChlD